MGTCNHLYRADISYICSAVPVLPASLEEIVHSCGSASLIRLDHLYTKNTYINIMYILVGPVAAKHPYKKRCSEGGQGG